LKNIYKIALSILSFTSINAQEPFAISLSKANGLPSNSVYNVFQDSKGFIWVTTNAGLTRYDGFEFKTYQCEEQTSTSGSSIKEDVLGRIWYENFDGYIYYVENDTLKSLQQNTPVGYVPIGITKQHLFVIQKTGVDVYDLRSLKKIKTILIATYNTQNSSSNDSSFYCLIDYTIYKIDANLRVTSTDYLKNKSELNKQIYSSKNGIYVVSKNHEQKYCYVFDENLKHLQTLNINEPKIMKSSSQRDHSRRLQTSRENFVYSAENNYDVLSYFKNKSISCVIKDRQNNIWFSTTNEGLYLVPNINNLVFHLNGYLPNKIAETKNGYYIATKKGEIIICDKSFNISSVIKQKSDKAEIYYLNYDSINNGLFYSSKGFTYIPNLNYNNHRLFDIAVKEIIRLDDNYYAIATSGFCGIMRVEKNINSKKSIWDNYFLKNRDLLFSNTAHIIDNVRAKSLAVNINTNSLYFATNIGLYKCSPSTNTEIKHNNKSFYASTIFSYEKEIYALSTKGDLYQISNDRDFYRLNKTMEIKEFDIKLIKLFGDRLVVVSQKFIYLLNLKIKKITPIDININTIEINDILLKENALYLITNSGIIKTAVENVSPIKKDALLQLNEFVVNDKKYDPAFKTVLNFEQNDIIIHFSLLDFGASTQNQLFYNINNDLWQPILNETRSIQFAALASGNYDIGFKLNDRVLPNKLAFTIANPFWKTWWFIFSSLLTLLLIVYLYYKWQINKLRIQNKLLEEKNNLLLEKIELELNLNKSVLKTIKAQMNPHFFYNALNTIQAYIFTNHKTKASNYLAKFSKLTRVILEQSEKETISLREEVESLTLYLELEKMRFNESFEYSLELEITSHKDSIELPPMLIQPYVENAVKHGLLHKELNKKLAIFIEEKINHLTVTIDDNGIGRQRSGELNKIKNEKYHSFSTHANEKRLEILNKHTDKIGVNIIDKFNDMGKVTGTKVILTIPTN